MPSEVDERAVVDDTAAGLANHSGLHAVVKDLIGDAPDRREGRHVTTQNRLHVLVQTNRAQIRRPGGWSRRWSAAQRTAVARRRWQDSASQAASAADRGSNRVRQQLLQPGVLAFQPLQALGLGDLKPAVLGLPVVEARLTDPVLAAQLGRLHPGLALLQDRNDLLFRMPLALHRLVLSQGQTPVHPGSIQSGNVTLYRCLSCGMDSAAIESFQRHREFCRSVADKPISEGTGSAVCRLGPSPRTH